MRTVRDVMSGDIEVLRTTESVTEAACYLASSDDDVVPVCLSDGTLAGVVTSRDIVELVVAKGLDPRQVTLAELASRAPILALDIGIPVEEAVMVMARAQRSRLPVTEGDHVVGFVTRRDAARALSFVTSWVDGET